MYEEAQLYSPVTTDDAGEVTVHLAHDHPGANDPEYRRRRNEIAAAALGVAPGRARAAIDYTEEEHEVWRTVCRELAPKHERYAVREYREAKQRVALPTDRVPGLDEVSRASAAADRLALRPRGRARTARGLLRPRSPTEPSTRRSTCATRLCRCTRPEPDIIHEVIGHGHLVATDTFGELHRLAGAARAACAIPRACASSRACSGSRSSSAW
jgi:phenylalanine-4-hydroxylase